MHRFCIPLMVIAIGSQAFAEIPTVSHETRTVDEKTFVVSEVSGLCWRLVHDGTKVIMLDYHDGVTSSVHEIVTRATLKECEAVIDSLKLTIDDMQLEGARYEAQKTGTAGTAAKPVSDISKTQ